MEKLNPVENIQEPPNELLPTDQLKYEAQQAERVNELWSTQNNQQQAEQIKHQEQIKEQAPILPPESFLTEAGDYVDFSRAQSIPEIIDQLTTMGEIKTGTGEVVSAPELITLIYDRLYNPYADWTKITLRHRLRESIYRLANDFRRTPDYLNNLNASQYLKATNLNELKLSLEDEVAIPATNGQIMSGSQAIEAIEYGRLDFLPAQLRFKIISLNRRSAVQSNQTTPAMSPTKSPTWRQSLSNTWSSVKSFFSRG